MTGDQISLREIRESDIESLREHRNDPQTRVWLESNNAVSAAQQVRWFNSGGSANFRVALSSGLDVGLARLSLDAATGVGVVGLDIFKDFRGRGLAHPVFRHICDAALGAGARSLALWVFWDNERAVRTYRAEGFVVDESEPVKWLMRQFPHETAPAPHRYVKMIRT